MTTITTRSAAPEDELRPLVGVPFTVEESIAMAGMPHAARWWAAASSAPK